MALHSLSKFALQLLGYLLERAELMQETGACREQHLGEQMVLAGHALRHLPAKELGVEGGEARERAEVPTMFLERAERHPQARRQSAKQVRGDAHLGAHRAKCALSTRCRASFSATLSIP